jgi:hypothetical protein
VIGRGGAGTMEWLGLLVPSGASLLVCWRVFIESRGGLGVGADGSFELSDGGTAVKTTHSSVERQDPTAATAAMDWVFDQMSDARCEPRWTSLSGARGESTEKQG